MSSSVSFSLLISGLFYCSGNSTPWWCANASPTTYDLSMSLSLNNQMLVDVRPSSSSVPSKPEKTKNDPLACLIMFSLS